MESFDNYLSIVDNFCFLLKITIIPPSKIVTPTIRITLLIIFSVSGTSTTSPSSTFVVTSSDGKSSVVSSDSILKCISNLFYIFIGRNYLYYTPNRYGLVCVPFPLNIFTFDLKYKTGLTDRAVFAEIPQYIRPFAEIHNTISELLFEEVINH